jgi:hypothetical protein
VEPVLARRRRLRALRDAASAEVFADAEDSVAR